MVEEKLEEVDLGSDSREPRPISISASLTEKEKKRMRKLWQKKMHRLWHKKNWKKLT